MNSTTAHGKTLDIPIHPINLNPPQVLGPVGNVFPDPNSDILPDTSPAFKKYKHGGNPAVNQGGIISPPT
jgi:hypothetical protein